MVRKISGKEKVVIQGYPVLSLGEIVDMLILRNDWAHDWLD